MNDAPFSLLKNTTVEDEAKRLSNTLVTKFHDERKVRPHLDSVCVDFMDGYPADEVIERASTLMANMWLIQPHQFSATSGRAGCIWISAKFPIK